MLRSHARNENECQTPCHRHSAANIEIPCLEILVNRKLVWNSWNLAWYHGASSKWCGKVFVPFGAGLGICFSQTRPSHNKHDGFGRERPNFGGETIAIASYCFQIFFSCQHRTTGVLCYFFVIFQGSFGHFLCIKCVFNAFMCIIQIWTTCTCSSAYKLVEKSNLCPWGACLGPMQEMGMNVKHPATVTRPQTLKYLVFKF